MHHNERGNLLAQKAKISRLIEMTPTANVIDLHSLNQRLADIELRLETAGETEKLAKAILTFSGKPVIDSYGIGAQFASEVINVFQEAVVAVATGLKATLAMAGPLPSRGENQLMITNTAIGSFGFQFEEAPSAVPAVEESPISIALTQTRAILDATTKTDDELTEAIGETQRRALDKIKSFLEVMIRNEAICTFKTSNGDFRFASVDQIRRSVEKISVNNVTEEDRTYTGVFTGALPLQRRFEFKVDDQGKAIVGRILPEVVYPDDPAKDVVEEINKNLNKPVTINVSLKMVGHAQPRFYLKSIPVWRTL